MRALANSLKQSFLTKNWLIAAIFVGVGLSLYANSFSNQMFWDDDDGILNNAFVKDWSYFPQYFSENLIAGASLVSNYWRPMLLAVYSFEWHLWGDSPIGYHLVNTLAHIASAILLFFLLFKLFRRRWLAFLTSLIFLVHPLQTEAVTYVSGLGDPLSSLFILSGLLLFLKYRDSPLPAYKSIPYYLSLLMYAFALLTKETGIIFIGLLALVDVFYATIRSPTIRSRTSYSRAAVFATIKALWPFAVIAAVYIILRATVLNFSDTFNVYGEPTLFTENFHIRLFTFFRVLVTYFSLLFVPRGLHAERQVEIAASFDSPDVILGGTLTLVLLALALTQFTRLPVISFGILWFFIKLFPNSNLAVPNSALMYEHWMYLPMVGFWLIIVWLALLSLRGVRRLVFDSEAQTRGAETEQSMILSCSLQSLATTIVFALFFTFLSAQTVKRNAEWRDPITFYSQTLNYAPNSYRILNNLGMAYTDVKNPGKAIEIYNKAIGIDANNAVAYHNRANAYREIGELEFAERGYKKALGLQPDFIFSKNALAKMYFELAQNAYNQSDRSQASNYIKKALEILPEDQTLLKILQELTNESKKAD